ncbi:DUF1579 family protein [Sphingopyxis sp.]|uniref:DUF1579 family protein n=1 Tax=Sphingopyxis sp. TaxID=1908224 RepID=UPI001D78F855|nr:DUF1579 family protein [Sphingopyxis sp.]MBW8294306.1 DUF1579 domain-containing protein [Sphingopyxis sp.]
MFRKRLIIAFVVAGYVSIGGDRHSQALAFLPPEPSAEAKARVLKDRQRKYNSIFPGNTPDDVLEPLLQEVGVWDADVELYVGEHEKQPVRKTGIQTNRLVSKGRYMLNDFRYTDGSYEGTGLWGWDAYHNRYSGIWMDGDHYLVRHDIGYFDHASKTIHWEADTLQPDGVTTRLRITERFAGTSRTFQMDLMDASTGVFNKLIFMKFTKRAG